MTKALYKNELARAAGVSIGTLRKWCKAEQQQLANYGVHPRDQFLTPAAVQYICTKYGITLP